MKKIFVTFVSIIILASCGGGGGGGGGGTTVPTTPAPTVSLSASPSSVLLENLTTLSWSSTNASSCSADWTSQTSTSGSEDITISTPGDNNFSITCTGDGGTRSASVTVEGYRNTEGIVVDGYITGADVFVDENNNWSADSSESSTTSDNEGKFTIKYSNGNLVSLGGTDLDSQTPLDDFLITHKLTGHSDFKAITPVTSVAAFMGSPQNINTSLGISASLDIYTFDPVANKGDGGSNDYLYEKGIQLTVLAYALQNITNNLNTGTETTQDYFKAIAEEIEKEFSETETKVNIETEAFITKVLNNVIETKSVTIEETSKSNAIAALAGVMPIIEVKSSDDLTTSIIRFAISTLQTDIQTLANGSASIDIVTSYTEDIINYIASDQNIDADEITPNVIAVADNVTTQEDTPITINFLANDTYAPAISTISFESGSNGTTSLDSSNPEQMIYTPDPNFYGVDKFSYTITQGSKTASAEITVTIESVNDLPTIDIASTLQVDENQQDVAVISISDEDEENLTIILGGDDADSFNLSSENVLTFKQAPDYETKSSYVITISASDGIDTVVKEITILINNLNDNPPIFDSVNNINIEENIETIATIIATDADGDSLIYSLQGNAGDNSELSIASDGTLSFVTAADYELKTLYTAVIEVTDGIFSDEITIVINIIDVNDNPPVIQTSGFSIDENQSLVGTIQATDVDTNTTFSYSISGTDESFVSVSDNGNIVFLEPADFETKNSYLIDINVSDGLNTATKEITIEINNILEDIISNTFSITDGTSSQAPILNVNLTLDELTDAKKVYAVLSSIKTSEGLECAGNGPAMELEKTGPINWSLTKELNTELADVCEYNINYYFNLFDVESETAPPTEGIHLTSNNKSMNKNLQWSNDYISPESNKVSIINPQAVNSVAIVNYNDLDYSFMIYEPSGVYSESCNTDTFVNDSGESSPLLAYPENDCFRSMVVPSLSDDSNKIQFDFYIYSFDELEYVIGYLSGATKITANNDLGRSDDNEIQAELGEIDSSNSKIARLRFEIDTEAAVRSDDINDAEDYSFEIYPTTKAYLYNGTSASSGSKNVNSITSERADMTPPEIISGSFSNYSNSQYPQRDYVKFNFTIKNDSDSIGNITSVRDLSINTLGPKCYNELFYVRDDLDGKIDVSTSNLTATIPILKNELGTYQITSININDFGLAESYYAETNSDSNLNHPLIGTTFVAGDGKAPSCPLWLNYSFFDTISLDENETQVGTFTAQGSLSDTVIYSLEDSEYISSEGTINQISTKLQINELTGEVTYINPPDYDKASDLDSGHFQVRATSELDSTLSRVIQREIVLVNLNDSSPEIISTQLSVEENLNEIGCISHSDKDVNLEAVFACLSDDSLGVTYSGNITFTVTGENVLINSSTGALSFENAPDYEETTSYLVTVTINDGINSTSSEITINVLDVNDTAPVVTSSKSYTVKENQSSAGTIQIFDPDTVNNAFTYTIDNTYEDGSMFAINSNGELTFVSNPDYESKSSYKVKVTINDGVFDVTEEFSITLEDVIAEAIPTYASLNLLPQESNSITVQLLSSVIDGRTASYSIENEQLFGTATLDTSTGILNYTTDIADVAVERIRFRVNDGVIDDGVADLTLNLNTDPLYKHTWYLHNTGQTGFASLSGTPGEDLNTDVSISSGFTGKGIGINVIDEGLEIAHEDLVGNIKEGFSYDCANDDTDPTLSSPYGDHGTSVAGIIAAKGWNNVGGRGVAPDADLIGYNYLSYQSNACQAYALGYLDDYSSTMDIFNMSYGLGLYRGSSSFSFPSQNILSELDDTVYKNGVNNLRNGKGALYIKSIGNDFDTGATNGDGCGEPGVDDPSAMGCSIAFHDETHTVPYIIGVAALKATGIKSSYSTSDPSIWISGFGGEYGYSEEYNPGLIDLAYEPAMMTTDQMGCEAGYVSYYYYPDNEFEDCWNYINGPHPDNIDGNYTNTFGGTSSAAPSVAGAIAVLLSAYPDLTWRDVKHIMASTGRKSDPERAYTKNGLVQHDWITNAAGYTHHYWYGFGAFDLGAAIDFGSTYTPDSLGTFNEFGWKKAIPKETITVSIAANSSGTGNVYVIDGIRRKSLFLNAGTTYTFIHSSAHPLRFSTTPDGTHAGGVEYVEGVTKSNGITTIKVTEDTPMLYYYCAVHSDMGADISFFDTGAIQNLNLSIPSFSSVEDTIPYLAETAGNFTEFIQIKIYLDKEIPKDIGMHLISPQGTEMSILQPFSNVSGNPSGDWFVMGVSGFYGEQINGDWTLKVTDYTDNSDTGILVDWEINIFGN